MTVAELAPLVTTHSGAAAPGDWSEPTTAELEAIEAEWPVLAAELAVVTAECRLLTSPDESACRALRRALAARDRAAAVALNRSDLRRTP